jgi:tetratricopeptide (TPR) repeat protein
VNSMTRRLTASLRETPTLVPTFAAMALFVVWATSQAGYPVTHWAPGTLIVLALLAIALSTGLRWASIPREVRIAVLCLAAYTALSFLSILWAPVTADAWEGANRTLLYLLVFALFALWPQRSRGVALLLSAWTLAMMVLALFVLIRLDTATSSSLQSLLPEQRLIYPSGYPNANAAQWLMALWPAVLLARSRAVPWALRGVLVGGAILLAEVALLSLSRGALYATPVMLVLVFALIRGRARTFAVVAVLALGIGAAAPAVLHVSEKLEDGAVTPSAVHSATSATLLASLAGALVFAFLARLDGGSALSNRARALTRRTVGALAIATLVVLLAGGWVAAGDPVARARHAWNTFTSPKGYAANSGGNRLVSGLGSQRYDVYRVALNEFAAHPLIGIGVDNFQQQYLAHGRTEVTPRYPHSVELRVLTETGIVGVLLALVGLGAALWAGARAARAADPLGRAVACAALAGFAYWVVHGSVDWFWEFAGLGAPAFALLGLACALAGRGREASRPDSGRDAGAENDEQSRPTATPATPWSARRRWLAVLAGAVIALVAAASLIAPWLSQLQIERAASIWTRAPSAAYASLDDAAKLNPLSDEPYLVAGSIALRFGDLARAKHEFSLALARSPNDDYATFELGAIASATGDHQQALRLLTRALQLYPRDPIIREARELVRHGRNLSVDELNRLILREAERLP